jgi:hypothetical protein
MKNSIQILLWIVLSAVLLKTNIAQTRGIEIGGLVGYHLGGTANEFKIPGAMDYEFVLNVPVRSGLVAQISYTRHDSELRLNVNGLPESTAFGISTEYIQGGALIPVKKGKFVPFGLILLGAARFAPKDSKFSDEWLFSVAVGGGAKFYMSERIGFRLQARALAPLKFDSAGIFCSSGGCSGGVSAGFRFFSLDFSAGVFIII